MSLSTWNTSLGAYANIKSNVLSDRMAKNRWGNKFKKLFLKHQSSMYGEFPAYSFKEGMMDCTNANGSTEDQVQDAELFIEKLDNEGLFKITIENITTSLQIPIEHDIAIIELAYFIGDEESSFDEQDGEVREYLREMILEEKLYDVKVSVHKREKLSISITALKNYVEYEIAELRNNIIHESKLKDDLDLIIHLGLCSTLANEIFRPHKVKSIWFRFKKEVFPPRLYKKGLFVGFDKNYDWWNEAQFKEIKKHVKDFKNKCIFVAAKEDVETGIYSPAYVYVDSSIFLMSGYKIYWFVKVFLDVGVRAKRNLFRQLLGAVVLVVSIYLTAVSANPAWMKIALVAISIASYSGVLSSKAQLVLAVLLFAYGVNNTNFSAMSSSQIFSWAIKNIEMVYKMTQIYEKIKLEEKDEEATPQEVQEKAMQFIYSDAYNQYDNFYSVMYDYEPNYKNY